MRSIFGECSGNVRSTPTPNDCFRTVNVSRAPEPCRLITIPSKTWTRRRWPSITWKWTRTVSPALKRGMSLRSWRCSMLSMIVLMEKVGGEPAANGSENSPDRNPVGRPVRGEDLPDQVLSRHRPPLAGVARLGTVVAHHEVLPLRDVERLCATGVPPVRLDVRLVELLAVDEDVTGAADVPQLDPAPREADQPLDEGAAGAAALPRCRRRLENDDLAALRVAEAVDEPVREHAVGPASLAPARVSRAVERRLHRRGRDPIGVDDPRLDREHDRDRADDGDDPVDRDPPTVREPVREPVDRVPRPTWSRLRRRYE